jgi:hypothetical protein
MLAVRWAGAATTPNSLVVLKEVESHVLRIRPVLATETDYTVKCNELPIVFCPTGGGNGKMNSKNKKGKKPKNNMNMRKLR